MMSRCHGSLLQIKAFIEALKRLTADASAARGWWRVGCLPWLCWAHVVGLRRGMVPTSDWSLAGAPFAPLRPTVMHLKIPGFSKSIDAAPNLQLVSKPPCPVILSREAAKNLGFLDPSLRSG